MDAFTGTLLASDPFGETFAVAGRGGREVRFRRLASAFAARDGFAELLLSRRDPILALAHPHLVTTVAIARDGKGRLIVAEGLPSGPSLAACLGAAVASGRAPGRDLALHIARAVVAGLAHMHGAGLVHGLVHPRSVYLDASGAIRLGDIAVAKAVAVTAAEAPELSAVALDELAPDDANHPVDTRLDIYRTGELIRMLMRAAGAEPDGELRELIERATARDPRERHADATELLVHLGEAAGPAGDEQALEDAVVQLVSDTLAAGPLEDAPAMGAEAAEIAGEVSADALTPPEDEEDEEDEGSPARAAAVTVQRASVPPPRLLARLRALPRIPVALVAAESVVALLLLVGLMSDPARPPRPVAAAPVAAAAIPAAPMAVEPPEAPAPLAPARCVLSVRSTPPEASVVIDGLSAGVTPVTVMGVACDRKVSVTIDKVGFEQLRKQVTLAAGEPFHLQASLARPRVMLRVASTPAGAQVAINGKPVGETPLAVELGGAAETAIVLQKKGYRPYRATLVPSVQRELAAQLVPLRRTTAGKPVPPRQPVAAKRPAAPPRRR